MGGLPQKRSHHSAQPASATSVSPVTKLAASEARKTTASATSSGLLILPRGVLTIP